MEVDSILNSRGDLAILIDEEETAIRIALRQRPDRRFHCLTTPIELDAEYLRYRRIEPTAKEARRGETPAIKGRSPWWSHGPSGRF